jgi:hypothetical protein
MHARMTRYEGGAPEEIEANLREKKGVVPTEFGQTEGMKGAVFLVDRQSGTVLVTLPVAGRGGDAGERRVGDPRSRGSDAPR